MAKIKNKVRIGIIGGTGVYDPELLTNVERVKVYTPFGAPSDLVTVGDYDGNRVAFLPRHGADHHMPPNRVPYRANLWALKQIGVERIIAPCAVGSLRKEMKPGDMVIADQFVDFTKKREYSFYSGGEVAHISMHEPFCPEMRQVAIEAAKSLNIDFHDKGTNITIQGPRYSTKAESLFFRDSVKADIIGMTLVPECQLARELEMCYVSIAAVTDYDAWSDEPVMASMVEKTMKSNLLIISKLLKEIVPKIPLEQTDACECWNSLDEAMH